MDKFDRIMDDWLIPLGTLAAVVCLLLKIGGVI